MLSHREINKKTTVDWIGLVRLNLSFAFQKTFSKPSVTIIPPQSVKTQSSNLPTGTPHTPSNLIINIISDKSSLAVLTYLSAAAEPWPGIFGLALLALEYIGSFDTVFMLIPPAVNRISRNKGGNVIAGINSKRGYAISQSPVNRC